ncbi:hypothetical protein RQP46_003348 [Phenoliferia psychrophenolica]
MNLDLALGHKSPDVDVAWNQRDLLLYQAGIGAKRNELSALYELSPTWHPPPTYPLVLALKGSSQDVTNFASSKDAGGKTPGLPELNPEKLVHAEQSITILKTIPSVSGPGWKLKKQCVGIKDVDGAEELVSPTGEVYARMISSAYAFGDYKAGGYNKSIAPKQPLKALSKPPARTPDFVFSEKTTEEQAILYRLSGDYNPLHIFPDIGKKMGFGGVILHGLASYGHAARAIILNVAGGDGNRLSFMSSRFTSPVVPGDELETSIWTSEENGGTRVDFVQRIKGSGKTCLGGGVAFLTGAGASGRGASKL